MGRGNDYSLFVARLVFNQQRTNPYRAGVPHVTCFAKDQCSRSCGGAVRDDRSRHSRLATALPTQKLRSQFDVGVTHNHYASGSVAAVHVDTAAAVQMDWMD